MNTYATFDQYLGKKSSRPVPPSCGRPRATRIVRRGPSIAVQYHTTDVVTLHPDGSVTLKSGGWQSVTTKKRMNDFSSAYVFQDKGVWYARTHRGTRIPYYDGMRISCGA